MIFLRLILIFTLVPLVELALLIELGRRVGTPLTVGLVIVTGFLGAALARSQGAHLLRAIRYEMAQGRVPAEGLVEGLLVLVGGLFLLAPGLLTDITGFVFVVPATRRRLIFWLRQRLEHWIETGTVRLYFRR